MEILVAILTASFMNFVACLFGYALYEDDKVKKSQIKSKLFLGAMKISGVIVVITFFLGVFFGSPMKHPISVLVFNVSSVVCVLSFIIIKAQLKYDIEKQNERLKLD